MRRILLAIMLWSISSTAFCQNADNYFDFEFTLTEKLTTELSIFDLSGSANLSEKVQNCGTIEIHSESQKLSIFMAVQPRGNRLLPPRAIGILPFATDWIIRKCTKYPDIIINSSPGALKYSFDFPSFDLSRVYLSSPSQNKSLRLHSGASTESNVSHISDMYASSKIGCQNDKAKFDLVNFMGNSFDKMFVLFITESGAKFLDQYYGKKISSVVLNCRNKKTGFAIVRYF